MSSEKIDTRRIILEACLALLAEGAGSGIRMSDIAKRAGVSRQALYLHFQSRGDLIIAATLLQDEQQGVQDKLVASRTALTGRDRLAAYVKAWCGYIPIIYPVARTILYLAETDKEVADAWKLRMDDMREGCEAAINALSKDGDLSEGYDVTRATDLLWSLISIRQWELLRQHCGWTQKQYEQEMEAAAIALFCKK